MRHITALSLVITALASYRLARFLVEDTLLGHWPTKDDPGSGYRKWIDGWAFDENGDDRTFLRGKVGDLAQCIFCVGFWTSVGSYFAYLYGPAWLHVVVVLWAIAGAQGFIGSRMNA